MARVGKAKRLRRRARLWRQAIRREYFEELADRFRNFMAACNCPGFVAVDDSGVSVTSVTGPLLSASWALDSDPISDIRAGLARYGR